MRRFAILTAVLLAGCARAGAPASSSPTPTPTATPTPFPKLQVRFLGVGGFRFQVGDDAILTAPLFTNPSMVDVTVGQIATDPARVDAFLGDVSGVKAIVSGHAHYDHLMDVPYVWTQTAGAMIYGNSSAKHLLAGFAPDASAGCAANPPDASWARVPRENVFAFDDPANDVVDYRMCEGMETCTGPHTGAGAWVAVPGSHVRIRALCSNHPDQFLNIHFAPGCVDADLCSPATAAGDWKEGLTLAYLIDFLDPASGAPAYRIYYQDAPYVAPIGQPHPDLLAEKAVDLAIVNGGNWEAVPDHPKPILGALQPRYAIVGHWEDFFRPQDQPIQPLPFLDTTEILSRMQEVLPAGPGDPVRSWIPDPQTDWAFDRSN